MAAADSSDDGIMFVKVYRILLPEKQRNGQLHS